MKEEKDKKFASEKMKLVLYSGSVDKLVKVSSVSEVVSDMGFV